MASSGLRTAKQDPEGPTRDHSHANVLRKEYTARSNALSSSPPSSKSKLVKPRSDTGDDDISNHSEHTNQPHSKPNKLRKAPGSSSSAAASSGSAPLVATKDPPETLGMYASSRKTFDASPPPKSPTLAKDPKMPHVPSRPAPMRAQSYSKRHASFDTPREVPLPAYPFGGNSQFDQPQPFDDSEGDSDNRKAVWTQLENGMRDFTLQPSGVTRKIRRSQDPSTSTSSGGYFDYHPPNPEPPHFNRNNSAPTPPHPSAAESVNMHYVGQTSNANGLNEPENGSGSGSERFPTPQSAQTLSEDDGSCLSSSTSIDDRAQSRDAMQSASEEGHLSTSSLPLPTSYGAEQVSRLPATPKPSSQAKPEYSFGWDNGVTKTPTNITDNPFDRAGRVRDGSNPGIGDSRLLLDRQLSTQRSSYPFVAQSGREIRLPATNPLDSSHSFDKSLQLPKVEAPEKLLHPLLARNYSTPDTASQLKSPGAVSTIATPGHDGTLTGSSQASTSPTRSSLTDRTSNTSGSSGASSDLPSTVAGGLARDTHAGNPGPDSSEAGVRQSTEDKFREQNPVDDRNTVAAMTVETTGAAYILTAPLPGYLRDEITLSTRKKRILHVVADGFVSGCGHFERRVSFGYDADMTRIRAEFNGQLLKITVPRRPTSSASSIGASSTAFNTGSSSSNMFWRGRSNVV